MQSVRLHQKHGVIVYPHSYFSLIPPFPRTIRAFVAMSFDSRFDARWEQVLRPALSNLVHGGVPLDPFRVDLSRVSDAILTEILEAIANSHVIVADITALGEIADRPIRSANVLYEVGLAHALRPPEEVVLFRSDKQKLDFDVAGVRVHDYDPDGDPATARTKVSETVVASLQALDARRRATVRAAGGRLTLSAAFLLLEAMKNDKVRHPANRTMREAVGGMERSRAIGLLLELGALRASLIELTPEILQAPEADLPMLEYVLTPFGMALVSHIASEMGALKPEMKAYIESLMPKPQGSAT
jgi:hypothetical protein